MEIIETTKQVMAARYEREVTTETLPLDVFYNAEDYHQKYSLQRHRGLMDSFNIMFPEFRGFVDSTSAARLNGFTAGQGSRALFDAEKNEYGFSESDLEKAVRF